MTSSQVMPKRQEHPINAPPLIAPSPSPLTTDTTSRQTLRHSTAQTGRQVPTVLQPAPVAVHANHPVLLRYRVARQARSDVLGHPVFSDGARGGKTHGTFPLGDGTLCDRPWPDGVGDPCSLFPSVPDPEHDLQSPNMLFSSARASPASASSHPQADPVVPVHQSTLYLG